MRRLTEYRVPKGGLYRKYPCFSPDIIPDCNCPPFFCKRAEKCNLVHINSRKCPYLQVIDRLAAYEDTGLEPEEIITLKSIKSWADVVEHELEKYTQAEKDGRMVVLPCKSGQTIWVESWIKGRLTSIEAPDITWIIENAERFGKEIFLTREEAEAALKKKEG